MKYLGFLAVFVILSFEISSTNYEICNSSYNETCSEIHYLNVTNCYDNEHLCTLRRGTNIRMELGFSPSKDFEKLKTYVHGILFGNLFPFFLRESDACKTGVSCPFKAGNNGTYFNDIEVKSYYPTIPVTVRWELRDEKGNDIVCIDIPSQIV